MHVIYADPDEGASRRVTDHLDDVAATVTTAATAADALSTLRATGADCLVCEHDLPDADAQRVVERAAETAADPAVVVHTDGGSEALAGEVLAAGADGYVPKTAAPAVLRQQVRDAVERSPDGGASTTGQGAEGAPRWRDRDAGDASRRADRLEMLQAVSRDLMGAQSRVSVAEDVVAAVERVLDHPLAGVRLLDEERGVLEPVALSERTRARTGPEALPVARPGEGPHGEAYEAGEQRVVDDVTTADVDPPHPSGSLLVQPLGDHGVLVVNAVDTDAFAESDAHVASILGATAAAAMDAAERAQELERAETILEAAGDAVFLLDADGRFVQVNDRMAAVSGYDREELVGAHASLLLDEADFERGAEAIRRLQESDTDVETTRLTVRTADGEQLACDVSQSLLSTAAFSGTVGTVRVVEERVEMERALRRRKRKIEGLHEVATRLQSAETAGEVCEEVVGAAEDILNFDACIVGLAVDDMFVVEARAGVDPERFDGTAPVEGTIGGRSFRKGESIVVDDVRARETVNPIDADFRAVLSVPLGEHGILQAISNEAGAYDGDDAELAELLAAHATSALDRVTYEDELRTERDRLAALFDNVPDPVASFVYEDGEPIVRSVNEAFEETFGFELEELAGENVNDYVVPADGQAEANRLDRAAVEGEVLEEEVHRRTVDGLREFEVTVVPVDLEDERPASFCIYADVTERKQRRERVEVLNRVLRHDLRNGMNIVRGKAELLADAFADDGAGASGADSEGGVEHAEAIVERADDLLSLAERTRAVERTLDREGGPDTPMELSAFLPSVAHRLRSEHPEATVSVSVPDGITIEGGELLEVALTDLVENAIVHNDRPEPSVSVEAIPDREAGDVRVRVTDDGPGIPEDERRLLAGDKEITQLSHGSGIGLWLVNWAVTHAGGDLSFETNDPRGSVVTVRLPLVGEDARTPAAERG